LYRYNEEAEEQKKEKRRNDEPPLCGPADRPCSPEERREGRCSPCRGWDRDKDKDGGPTSGGGAYSKVYPTVVLTNSSGANRRSGPECNDARAAAAAGGHNLTASFDLRENTYDKRGAQELVISNLRITNHGPRPVELRGPSSAGDSEDVVDVALNVSFNPTVVYNGSGYQAPPQEFRLGCWRNDEDTGDEAATPASAAAPAAAVPNCSAPAEVWVDSPPSPGPGWVRSVAGEAGGGGGGSEYASDIQVYADFSNRSVALRFGRAEKHNHTDADNISHSDTAGGGTGAIVLCANCTLTIGKLSFYHMNWLAFGRGVVALDAGTGAPAVTLSVGYEQECDDTIGLDADDDESEEEEPMPGLGMEDAFGTLPSEREMNRSRPPRPPKRARRGRGRGRGRG
jgi:hypothetical protein